MTRALAFAGDWLPTAPLGVPPALADAALVCNLECAIGGGVATGSKAYVATLGESAYADITASPVRAASVANNHVLDLGAVAFDDMLTRLRAETDIAIYGTRDAPFAELEVDGRRVAVIGALEPCRARGDRIVRTEDVAALLRELESSHDVRFVTPHWGKEGEYAHHPAPWQRDAARRWIDAGASGVFGHHPHTVHARERIDGARVHYSLGNLRFDHEEGRGHPLTRFGLALLWRPGAEGDGWEEIVLDTASDRVAAATPAQTRVFTKFLDEISRDLESGWDERAWARRVGPVYVPKSMQSWKLRFGRRAVRTAALWSIWRMLPTTRALLRGARDPDSGTLARIDAVTDALALDRR